MLLHGAEGDSEAGRDQGSEAVLPVMVEEEPLAAVTEVSGDQLFKGDPHAFLFL